MQRDLLFKMIFYSITYNAFQLSFMWSHTFIKELLEKQYGIDNEEDLIFYGFNQTSLYSLGIMLSGFLWQQIQKKLSFYHCI